MIDQSNRAGKFALRTFYIFFLVLIRIIVLIGGCYFPQLCSVFVRKRFEGSQKENARLIDQEIESKLKKKRGEAYFRPVPVLGSLKGSGTGTGSSLIK